MEAQDHERRRSHSREGTGPAAAEAEEVLKFADSLRAEADADEAEERAVEEARQWLRENGGKGIPHEVVLADFGLTMDDFRRMAEERARLRG
jgi:hypothetical protein